MSNTGNNHSFYDDPSGPKKNKSGNRFEDDIVDDLDDEYEEDDYDDLDDPDDDYDYEYDDFDDDIDLRSL